MPNERLVCHEALECLLAGSRQRMLHAIAGEAVALPLYRASLRGERLIPYELTRTLRPFLNDDRVIRCSDFTRRLTGRGATAFLPSYRSSPFLERWARAAGLELLSPPYRLQQALEDKVRFHRLAQQHGLPVPDGRVLTTADQIGKLPRFPLVCQRPAGEGMEGTFLVHSRRQLRAELDQGSLALPLLCREFIRGPALGITIVVGAHELILSAVRVQCRRLAHREQDFAGVQWVPGAAFSPAQRRKIARVMDGLGRALRQAGLRGVANVDFFLSGDEVALIECNPRFSSSTPQLAFDPSLLHGLDFMDEYLRAVRGRPLHAHRPRLPRSEAQPTYVDFSDWAKALMQAAGRRVVSAMPRLGVYDMAGGRLRYVSPKISDLRGRDRVLFHYSTPAGRRISGKADLGSVLASFPLFSFARGRSALTRRGRALLLQLASEVRFARPRETLAELWLRAGPARPPAGSGG